MPFTAQQFVRGADYSLAEYARREPIDQVNTDRPFLNWLIANKQESRYGNGLYRNPVFVTNGGNTQRYFGAAQVTYNSRDPVRQAGFQYANLHDGFLFDEDTLKANDIVVTDDSSEAPTTLEKSQLVNLLGQSYRGLREGLQNFLGLDTLQNGTQSVDAVAGLDLICSTTPATGTIGELAASNTWWQNNASLSIAPTNLIDQMEIMHRACLRFGKIKPTKIICGAAFLDVYRQQAGLTINRRLESDGLQKGGVSLDAGITGVYFKGVELHWDPTFELLDTQLGVITHPWTKRCYFLNEQNITLRPYKGAWMVKRKPERLPDRYVHYFGQTASFGITTNKRNSLAVLSIA